MYWNQFGLEQAINAHSLNSNIRCIEIYVMELDFSGSICWIVTLDVLKCVIYTHISSRIIVE